MNVFFVHCSLYCLRNKIESHGKRLLPQMKNLLRFVSERQVISPQIPKINPVLDDMVYTQKNPVCNRRNGSFGPPAGLETVILVLEVGVLLLDRRPGHLDHNGLQMMLPYRTFAALAFPGALIVAGAQTAPGYQGRVLPKTIQGGTYLRQDLTGGNIGYARRLLHAIQ